MATGRTAKEQLGVELDEPERLPEPEPQEEVQEAERPEWLPEKFKDEQAFVKSYSEMEQRLTQQEESHRQEIEGLRELMTGMAAQQPQQSQQPDQQMQEQLYQAYENDPVGLMVFLAQQAAQQQMQAYQQNQQPQFQAQQQLQGELIADNASRLLEAKYPDWREYEAEVGNMIEQNPALLPVEVLSSLDQTTATLEAIYKQAKYDDLAAQLDAVQQGDNTQMKRQAQSMSGNAGRPPEPSLVDVKMDQLLAAARGSSYSAFRDGK